MNGAEKKTLGKAIDEIVAALEGLDESTRATAVRAACEHLSISGTEPAEPGSVSSSGSTPPPAGTGGASPAPPPPQVLDIRTLKEQKQPTSATEMACLVAYYLESLAPPPERKRELSTSDLEQYFKQGDYPLPKRMAQVLVNARSSGYFDSAGHGKYRLNPVGHNLVAHSLPRSKK